jgi:MFS family permease
MGLWVAMIGLGLGACFSLSLTLTLEHLRTPAEAGSLAAFVQGMGFIVTGIVPYITGWLRDVSGDFQASWTLLTCTVLAMLLVTARFARVAMPGPSPGQGRQGGSAQLRRCRVSRTRSSAGSISSSSMAPKPSSNPGRTGASLKNGANE